MLSTIMSMPSLPFDAMNETDIREEVIAPLIRKLGYGSGTENNVIREQLLRYPQLSLGRKNPKKDPELRGKADYILQVKNRLQWIIEAKAPSNQISTADIEQAWTYANHPEVRAIYFALCNGRRLIVHRTTDGPQAAAVLSINYETMNQNFPRLESLLGPDALLRDFSGIEPDVGMPIAPGLRSVARITSGVVSFRQSNLGSRVFEELQMTIREGAIERDDSGRLKTFLSTIVPMRSWQELNERLRLSNFEMTSEDGQLAIAGQKPTIFIYEGVATLAAGETLFDISTWSPIKLPMNVTLNITSEAKGTYRDRVFSGEFRTKYSGMGMEVMMLGSFEVYLA